MARFPDARLRAISRVCGGCRSLRQRAGDPVLTGHLKALLKDLISDRVLVAVGALHLNGPGGLLALIEKQGYRITRVL